jgi:hypothetical protein
MSVQDPPAQSDPVRKVIEQYEAKRLVQLGDVARTERIINELLVDLGEPVKYAITSVGVGSAAGTSTATAIGSSKKRSRYYGKPLATAVRMYLETLQEQPAMPNEILAELEAGEFNFDAMGWQKDGRLRSLAMSLAKNTVTFHRLPSGAFGLTEWYPNARPVRKVINPFQTASASPEDKDDPEIEVEKA